jgi:hypothetical protein
MTAPYRESELPERAPEPKRELVYVARDAERKLDPYRIYIKGTLLGAVLALAGIFVGLPPAIVGSAAAVAVIGGLVLGVWRWRKGVDMPGRLLRLGEGSLRIYPDGAGRGAPIDLSVRDIKDVKLETKSVQKLQNTVRADGVPSFGGSLDVDTSRIVFVLRGKKKLALTEQYVSHSDCLQWMGKVRTLLRSGGWLPVDERAPSKRPGDTGAGGETS